MVRPGPKPLSESMKQLCGSRQRPAPVVTVQAISKLPPVPKRFDAARRALWKAWGRRLMAAGTLTALDTLALELLVDVWHEYELASAGPDRRRADKAHRAAMSLLKEFGLTPASRRGVTSLLPAASLRVDPASRYFTDTPK